MIDILFPARCVLCHSLLPEKETDLCHKCRKEAPEWKKGNFKISFVARWAAIWYYKDGVRQSLQRYKFSGRRHYHIVYGRLLALKIQSSNLEDFDVLTWVPSSFRRRWSRGFDHTALIAKSTAKTLGCKAVPILRKVRHNPPQSGMRDFAKRRANVLGVYQVRKRGSVAGKRILLIDDIVTSGATLSECAKTLTFAGADTVLAAAVAARTADKPKDTSHM